MLSAWFIFVLQFDLWLLAGSSQQQFALSVLHAKEPVVYFARCYAQRCPVSDTLRAESLAQQLDKFTQGLQDHVTTQAVSHVFHMYFYVLPIQHIEKENLAHCTLWWKSTGSTVFFLYWLPVWTIVPAAADAVRTRQASNSGVLFQRLALYFPQDAANMQLLCAWCELPHWI